MQPLVLINAVGLTPRLLAHAPRLKAVAAAGWQADMPEVLPAVTCTAQATLLTGELPNEHGVVANGWLFRDTNEVRFWQQSNRLIQAEPLYATARRRAQERGRAFKSREAVLVVQPGGGRGHQRDARSRTTRWTATRRSASPARRRRSRMSLERRLGPFPFPAFWGPMAGLPCTQWIAAAAGARAARRSGPT